LVDYAHNPAGYEAVGGFVRNWRGERIGAIGGPGDRRDEDLIMIGKLSAQIFDRIIIKEDDDKRGRDSGEVADLIAKGIYQENPNCIYETILDEAEAINSALDRASRNNNNTLVVIFPESVTRAIDLIKQRQ
jgi:cyanophycin synthetase